GVDLAPGVDDADHRLAGPILGVVADLAQPGAVAERAHVGHAEPAVAAKIFGAFAGHCCSLLAALASHGRINHTRPAAVWGEMTGGRPCARSGDFQPGCSRRFWRP